MATDYKTLYYKTETLLSKFKPSLSNYFDVFIEKSTFGGASNRDINFLAYEAVLPGTSLETTQVFGDRQGLTQTYANKRVYPPVDVSFYVDSDYRVLEYFEQWISTVVPNKGNRGTSYQKFTYPNLYKQKIIITKFERDFRSPNERLIEGGKIKDLTQLKSLTFELLDAYPVNLISLPVSYEGANLLRTTVTFNYDIYHFENHALGTRTEYGNSPLASDSSAQPGGDTQDSEVPNILGNTQSELERLRGEAARESLNRTPLGRRILAGGATSPAANQIGSDTLRRVTGQ